MHAFSRHRRNPILVALASALLTITACQDPEGTPDPSSGAPDFGSSIDASGSTDLGPRDDQGARDLNTMLDMPPALDLEVRPDAGDLDLGEDATDMNEPDAGEVGVEVDLSLADRCEASFYETCSRTIPLPDRVRTLIDLTDPSLVEEGRCDREFGSAYTLPDDPEAYPVLVRVASQGFDGECTRCGESRPPFGPTTYGVALGVPYEGILMAGQYTVVASVNAPWRVVAGEVGEAGPHACLSEYLEFQPTTCLHSYTEGVGVVTDETDPPIAELLVELLAPREVDVCCHLPCPETP